MDDGNTPEGMYDMRPLERPFVPKVEETYPYCRYCGRYMGYPNAADHAMRHREDCAVTKYRRCLPQFRQEATVILLGDVIDGYS